MDAGNPYQSPAERSEAAGDSLIPEGALPALRMMLRTQRFIVLALAAGATSYALYSLATIKDKLVFAQHWTTINVGMLAFSAVAIVLSFVLHQVMFRFVRPSTARLKELGPLDPSSHAAINVLIRMQTAMIVACAVLEFPAFANGFAFTTTGELLNLIAMAVSVGLILMYFPRWNATLERIERELRNQQQGMG